MSLPELVVFSVNDTTLGARYLSFTGPQRQLRCGHEEGVFSDLTSFVVEPAQNGLVHIRSRYENRFWVRPSRFEPWLLASAPDPVEDLLDEGCTLFRPRLAAGNVSVSFVHVQSGLNVAMRPTTDAEAYNLCVELAAPTDFNFIDLSSLIKLPKYVAIQGGNSWYLTQRSISSDSGDLFYFDATFIVQAIIPTYTKNGRDIRFKTTLRSDRFVRTGEPQHRINTPFPQNHPELEPDNPRVLFEILPSSPDGFALRSRLNNLFCGRFDNNLFIARFTSQQDRAASLRPMDPMRSRLVTVTSFRHARVTRTTNVFSTTILYNPNDQDVDVSVTFEYTDTRSRTWSHSFMSLLGKTVGQFRAQIPFVNSTGQLEYPSEVTSVSGAWLETTTSSSDVIYRPRVSVPARTRLRVSLVRHVATCYFPFSYEQVEVFKFNTPEIQSNLDDGVLIDHYGYNVETRIETLTAKEYDALVGIGQELSYYQVSKADKGSDAQDDMMSPVQMYQIRPASEAQDGIKPEADASDQMVHEAI